MGTEFFIALGVLSKFQWSVLQLGQDSSITSYKIGLSV